VILTGQLNPETSATAYMGFAVSGATSISAADTSALQLTRGTDAIAKQASAVFVVTTLTAGDNTFTIQCRVSGGAAVSFANRNLIVIPLP
jgi:hypothetical protein